QHASTQKLPHPGYRGMWILLRRTIPSGGLMNIMHRVARLLLGISFCRYLSSAAKCALDSELRIAPAPSFILRVLRAALIAALLVIALVPELASAASPTPPAGNSSVAELEHLVQTLKDDK